MTSPVRALWDAPAASPAPPRRVWRDWALVGVLPPLVVLEAASRAEVPWRWLWAAVLIVLVPTLLWRRTRPLTMLAVAFVTESVVGLVTGGDPQLFTTAYFLILIYALMRWGDGRAMVIGGAILLAGTAVTFIIESPTAGDVIGGLAVLVATSTLGLTFRWRASARGRELDRMRLLEREQFARDLHDTVAHHVSAIAIQAQAGTAVAPDDPAAAAAMLQVIESEASRTLDEMRAMVRVLRRDDDTDLAERMPSPGIDDVRGLAQPNGYLVVDVQVQGDVTAVPRSVATALFRLAQEAVTNARRHARHATRVDVLVRVDAEQVRLEVRDDGGPAASAKAGYGTTGMRERAALLGGTCEAGPLEGGGWVVTAVLPLVVRSS
ncbi:histidine kinase [Microbacterium sp. P5_E9]